MTSAATMCIFALISALAISCQAADITVAWKSPLAAAKINAKCGDRLIFTFTRGASTVVQIQAASCTAAVVKNWGNSGSVAVPATTGLTFFKSSVGSQCTAGKVLLTVNTTCPPSPSPPRASPKPPSPKLSPPPKVSPPPPPAGKTILVTNSQGNGVWAVGASYATIQAKCGDTLKFVWTSGYHDVTSVSTQTAYNQCDFSSGKALSPMTSNSVTIVPLTTAGTTYYVCSVGGHCRYGQKVAVTTTC